MSEMVPPAATEEFEKGLIEVLSARPRRPAIPFQLSLPRGMLGLWRRNALHPGRSYSTGVNFCLVASHIPMCVALRVRLRRSSPESARFPVVPPGRVALRAAFGRLSRKRPLAGIQLFPIFHSLVPRL